MDPRRLCGSRSGLGWPESTTLDRDNLPGGVTHLCPRGPVATGLGPDWSEERDVAGAGLERVEGADIRRAGPNGPRASNVSLGANGTLIPVTGVIGDNGIFPVTDRTSLEGRDEIVTLPDSTQWIP